MPDEVGDLYRIAVEYPHLWPRLCEDTTPPPHDFPLAVWNGAAAVFVVADRRRPGFYGCATIHSINTRNDTAILEAVTPSQLQQADQAQLVVALIDYTFRTWKTRKVYWQYHDYTSSPLALLGELANVEGVLREHTYHNRLYWDRYTLSVFRDDWNSSRTQLISKYHVRLIGDE